MMRNDLSKGMTEVTESREINLLMEIILDSATVSRWSCSKILR